MIDIIQNNLLKSREKTRMNNKSMKNMKFICLDCLNKFKVNCENIFINDLEQQINCGGRLLECTKCHSNTIIPFVGNFTNILPLFSLLTFH